MGQVYEREEIQKWLRANLRPRCPNTNVVLASKSLAPDTELRGSILAWRAAVAASE